jgi:type VI secretion system protein ImpC
VPARAPYGPDGARPEAFFLREFPEGPLPEAFPRMSAAWVFAARVTDAYARTGWPARISGPDYGRADGLAAVAARSLDGGTAKSLAEVGLPALRGQELEKFAIAALVGGPEGRAYFATARSCYEAAAAAPREAPPAQLDALLCSTRVAQYAMVLARDNGATGMRPADVERLVNGWLAAQAHDGPERLTAAEQARRPLKEAKFALQAGNPYQPGNPYADGVRLQLQVQPSYLLDAKPTMFYLQTGLPAQKQPELPPRKP